MSYAENNGSGAQMTMPVQPMFGGNGFGYGTDSYCRIRYSKESL